MQKRKKSARLPRPLVEGAAASADEELSEALGSDWSSFVADLSGANRSAGPTWRVHDRTHIEVAYDYVLKSDEDESYVWECYFFVPESLRLHDQTYQKSELYDDLQSYVRLALPQITFGDAHRQAMDPLREAVASGVESDILREMKLYACLLRSSGLDTKRELVLLMDTDEVAAAAVGEASLRVVQAARTNLQELRFVLSPLRDNPRLCEAVRWIDEDVSRVIEMLLGELAVHLQESGAPESVAAAVAGGAVAEARYRRENGLEGVGSAKTTSRDAEHLEFRRHVLKRYTSSVLWLALEVRQGAKWVSHVFNAVAAGFAATFALVAAFWNGFGVPENLIGWSVAAILAYAAKDRIKALLQAQFSTIVSKHFPDREWTIRDKERKKALGIVHERAGFINVSDVAPGALALRRQNRNNELEDSARPERVIWHYKKCALDASAVRNGTKRFTALTEILRLNLASWLEHTDDPKQRIVFADPDDHKIYTVMAPRVYNIGVVCRLRSESDADAPWHRTRVVVTRKGISRLEAIKPNL